MAKQRSTFEGYVVMQTSKAFLFHGHYWHEPEWLPKSQVLVRGNPDAGAEEVVVLVAGWLAEKNKFEEFKERMLCSTSCPG